MPTQARPAYGTAFRLGDGVPQAALALSSASNTQPILISTASPHNVTDVSHGTVAGVGGTTAANGSWVVERIDATTLRLRGSVGNGAYSGGGTLTLDSTYATVAELRDIADAGLVKDMADVSAHDGNGWGSSIPIIKRGKSMRLTLNTIPTHPTHDHLTGLLFLGLQSQTRPMMVVYPGADKTAMWFQGRVQDHGTGYPIGPLQSDVVVEIDGQISFTRA